MIRIGNFYQDKRIRLKNRKRYKLKLQVLNSSITNVKNIVYVFRSNKHIYLQLVINGNVIASSNTIKYKKNDNNVHKYRREVIFDMVNDFYKQICTKLLSFKIEQFIYDISYYKYKGCVKSAIDTFRQLVQKELKSENS